MYKSKQFLILLMCVALATVPFERAIAIEMIPTQEAVSQLQAVENRAKVERFLQRQDVKTQFENFGVSAEEARTRVASLSDAEVNRIATQMEQAPAGADTVVISLTTVLLIVIILILLRKI